MLRPQQPGAKQFDGGPTVAPEQREVVAEVGRAMSAITTGQRVEGWMRGAMIVAALLAAGPLAAQPLTLAHCTGSNVESGVSICTTLLGQELTSEVRSRALWSRGVRLFTKGDLDGALRDYEEAISVDSANALAYDGRAQVHLQQNLPEKALLDLSKAIRLGSERGQASAELAIAYTMRGLAHYRMGDLGRSIADSSEAIGLDPEKQFSAYANRGSALREKGDLDGALADLNVAIRLNAYASRPLYQRGLTYLRKGDLPRALADYEAALVLNPKETDAAQGRDAVRAAMAAQAPASTTTSGVAAPNAAAAAALAATNGSKASRAPYDGHVWKPFESKPLRLRMLVQEAIDPAERYVFTARGDWVEQHRPSDGVTFDGPKVIRVLKKRVDQSLEDAIEKEFISKLPAEARASCRAAPAQHALQLGAPKVVLEIVPTGRYATKIDAELKEGPRIFDAALIGKGKGRRTSNTIRTKAGRRTFTSIRAMTRRYSMNGRSRSSQMER